MKQLYCPGYNNGLCIRIDPCSMNTWKFMWAGEMSSRKPHTNLGGLKLYGLAKVYMRNDIPRTRNYLLGGATHFLSFPGRLSKRARAETIFYLEANYLYHHMIRAFLYNFFAFNLSGHETGIVIFEDNPGKHKV